MGRTWTPEQKAAITLKRKNLLVSAGAGSGKTAVLTARIIERLTDPDDPADITSLLIVTFTKAAAAELRERILSEIYARLDKEPDNTHLASQITLLPLANITTIDSFCYNIVKNNANALGLDSSFQVMDNTECEMIKEETLEKTLAEQYQNPSEFFSAFSERYLDLKSDRTLCDIVLSVYSFLRSLPFYLNWLERKTDGFTASLPVWQKVILEQSAAGVGQCLKNYETALSLVYQNPEFQKYEVTLSAERAACERLLEAFPRGWDRTIQEFSSLEFKSLSPIRTQDTETKETIKALRDEAKSLLGDMKTGLFFLPEADVVRDLSAMEPCIRGLCETIVRFDENLMDAKKKKNAYEFSDLEHFTLRLFSVEQDGVYVPSSYAEDFSQSCLEILIDEYQDTNELQEMIFSLLSGHSNRFYVGDLKQSIYKFRHANPYIFKEKKSAYSADYQNEDVQISLTKNFRSREGIIEGINLVFCDVMTERLGEIEYKDGEELVCGAVYHPLPEGADKPCEMALLDLAKPNEEENDELDFSAAETEALFVAQKIKKLLSDGFLAEVDGLERKLEFKDIAVLMRSPGPVAQAFSTALSASGIPVFSDVGGRYFSAQEVSLMISILETIDNPMCDIPLAAVMRSPIFLFTDNELLEIRLYQKCEYYYQCVEAIAKEESALGQKCAEFLKTLASWQKTAQILPVHSLIWKIYEDTDFFAICASMPDAEQRLVNLKALFAKAKQYEENGFGGLYRFIDFIKRVKLSGSDGSQAKTMAENQNAVRILSIHKSKGLEFPVVFLCGTGKKFNEKDRREKILCHPTLGFGIDYVNLDPPYTYPNISKSAIAMRMEQENTSEEMRLLYVAMTRARQKLIVSGTFRDLEKSFQKWSTAATLPDSLYQNYLSSNKSYAGWILPPLIRKAAISSLSSLEFQDKESPWAISRYETADLLQPPEPAAETETVSQEIKQRAFFQWDYPEPMQKNQESKLSVSELASLFDDTKSIYQDYSLVKIPEFLAQNQKPSAAQIGTWNHLVMKEINLHQTEQADIDELVCRLIAEHKMEERAKKYISSAAICNFFQSELGKRLCASSRVYRETSFEIPVPASRVYSKASPKQSLLIQGIIDCFFYEGDEIILLDYKSDFAHGEHEKLRQKYQIQIDLYAEAVGRIMKKMPKEKIIYLFSDGGMIRYK